MIHLSPPAFEHTGWNRIDISSPAGDTVQATLRSFGVSVHEFDLGGLRARFHDYIKAPEYEGEFPTHGAPSVSFLEKALEHFISYELALPSAGSVGINVGSSPSVAPAVARRLFDCTIYEQDRSYLSGFQSQQIRSGADAIPLPDQSVDFMTLHCTFEHFEGATDTGFVREASRLLKPAGRVVILPLYLSPNYCNITGETDPAVQATIGFDAESQFRCVIPEWQNRFGRYYSPAALAARVTIPAQAAGLNVRLLRCHGGELINPNLWLRWILLLEKP